MKLQDLLEMPRLTRKEMDDDMVKMTPFFITDERLSERYNKIAAQDNVEVYLHKKLESAMLGVRGPRRDSKSGILIYGDLHFKASPNLGFPIDRAVIHTQKILQVELVNVVRTDQFRGLGTFLYSSLVQAGFTVISDNHQFIGGKELWQKIGRTHLANETVFVIDKGVVKTENERPIEYDGTNIPEEDIWSDDEQHAHVLFVYQGK